MLGLLRIHKSAPPTEEVERLLGAIESIFQPQSAVSEEMVMQHASRMIETVRFVTVKRPEKSEVDASGFLTVVNELGRLVRANYKSNVSKWLQEHVKRSSKAPVLAPATAHKLAPAKPVVAKAPVAPAKAAAKLAPKPAAAKPAPKPSVTKAPAAANLALVKPTPPKTPPPKTSPKASAAPAPAPPPEPAAEPQPEPEAAATPPGVVFHPPTPPKKLAPAPAPALALTPAPVAASAPAPAPAPVVPPAALIMTPPRANPTAKPTNKTVKSTKASPMDEDDVDDDEEEEEGEEEDDSESKDSGSEEEDGMEQVPLAKSAPKRKAREAPESDSSDEEEEVPAAKRVRLEVGDARPEGRSRPPPAQSRRSALLERFRTLTNDNPQVPTLVALMKAFKVYVANGTVDTAEKLVSAFIDHLVTLTSLTTITPTDSKAAAALSVVGRLFADVQPALEAMQDELAAQQGLVTKLSNRSTTAALELSSIIRQP